MACTSPACSPSAACACAQVAAQPEPAPSRSSWGEYVASAYNAGGFVAESAVKFYDDTADVYNKLATPDVWLAPSRVAELTKAACTAQDPSESLVLDFGAGTGLLGVALAERGFAHIDALEPSLAMLEQAPADVYSNKLCGMIGDVPDSAYDVIVSTGVIGTHVGVEDVGVAVGKLKEGGILVFSCKADEYDKQDFASLPNQEIIYGPAPFNKDMPFQRHVVVKILAAAAPGQGS